MTSLSNAITQLGTWPARRWKASAVAMMVVALALGLPTDVIPNPVFGRPVPVTWWSYPVLVVTATLGGLLLGTFVRVADGERLEMVDRLEPGTERPAKAGGVAWMLSFFAVGCPVCNHLVVLAIGTTGALQWFEPFQPFLAVMSVALLAAALVSRLSSTDRCPLPA